MTADARSLPELAAASAVIDIAAAARYLGVSRRTAQQLAAEKRLPGQLPRFDRKYTVSARHLHDWIMSNALVPVVADDAA